MKVHILIAIVGILLSISGVDAQNDAESAAQKYFTDVELVNQDGKKMRLYSDLMKGRVVVINSFYTSCISSCPVMNQRLQKIQDAVGDRLGNGVHIISITVDPAVDTPEALKAYSKKLNARPGWYFMTGDKASLDMVLGKLGHPPGKREDHSTVWAIGNDRTGLWKRVMGLASAEDLIKEVEAVINDKPPPIN